MKICKLYERNKLWNSSTKSAWETEWLPTAMTIILPIKSPHKTCHCILYTTAANVHKTSGYNYYVSLLRYQLFHPPESVRQNWPKLWSKCMCDEKNLGVQPDWCQTSQKYIFFSDINYVVWQFMLYNVLNMLQKFIIQNTIIWQLTGTLMLRKLHHIIELDCNVSSCVTFKVKNIYSWRVIAK